jgi:sporulation protein YlmC with PRC-barrel domain
MEIREGASVVTTKDDKVGTVYRIVIDPRTMQITHLVVRKGFLFTDDKVLPMNLVERADGETVVLRSDAGDLDELPDFSEKEYIHCSNIPLSTPNPRASPNRKKYSG